MQLFPSITIPDELGLTIAAVLAVVLVFWTWDRARGEGSDPSISIGRDDMLHRWSGIVAVFFVTILAAWFGRPVLESMPKLLLLPAAVLAYWAHSEWMEGS